MMVVQDVTIFAGDGLVGLSGGSGSGGSHYGVRVVGGKYGVDFTTAQPGPVISGFTLENQTCSALVYAGLQALTAVGLTVRALVPMAQPPIVTGCDAATNTVPSWQGQLFGKGCELPQFADPHTVQPCRPLDSGPLTLVDSIIELSSPPPPPPPPPPAAAAPAAGKATAAVAPLRPGVAILAAASLYLRNVWIGGGTKTLVQFQPGGHVLASPGGAWVEVGEYARGMWQSSAPDEEHLEKAGGVAFTSGVHVLSGSDLKPLGAASSSNVTTGELIVGVRSSR